METLITMAIFLVLVGVIAVPYWRSVRKRGEAAKQMHAKSEKAGLLEPVTLHPRIDLLTCIGCASCVKACPEDVLGIIDGRAAIVNGARCIGHAICADVCPVGAIAMGYGRPRQGMELPFTDEHHQTNIPGIYITGELGGMGLIRNAFEQGVKAVGRIAETKRQNPGRVFDVVIVGGGPSGIGAALAAQERGLSHIVIEQGGPGGTVLHYPKHKVVLTQPVELPLYGKLKISEISKEELLTLFAGLINDFRLNVRTNQKVDAIDQRGGLFHVRTSTETYVGMTVILALGRRGSPRKLGVPGEELSKVFYRLEDAEQYSNRSLLVVGGGDSAVEAAIGLARQKGNKVTISYRREDFIRLKDKNDKRVRSMIESGALEALFSSEVAQIQKESVVIKQEGNILRTLPNDFVFIFAGGELPGEFLRKVGIKLMNEEREEPVAIAV